MGQLGARFKERGEQNTVDGRCSTTTLNRSIQKAVVVPTIVAQSFVRCGRSKCQRDRRPEIFFRTCYDGEMRTAIVVDRTITFAIVTLLL